MNTDRDFDHYDFADDQAFLLFTLKFKMVLQCYRMGALETGTVLILGLSPGPRGISTHQPEKHGVRYTWPGNPYSVASTWTKYELGSSPGTLVTEFA